MKPDRMAWAAIVLIVTSVTMVLLSDLLIRARGLDGKHGLDAHSYDVVGSIMLAIGLIAFWRAYSNARHAVDMMVTRRMKLGNDGGMAQAKQDQALAHLKILVGTYFGKVHLMVLHSDPYYLEVHLTGPNSKVNAVLQSFVDWMYAEMGPPIRTEILP